MRSFVSSVRYVFLFQLIRNDLVRGRFLYLSQNPYKGFLGFVGMPISLALRQCHSLITRPSFLVTLCSSFGGRRGAFHCVSWKVSGMVLRWIGKGFGWRKKKEFAAFTGVRARKRRHMWVTSGWLKILNTDLRLTKWYACILTLQQPGLEEAISAVQRDLYTDPEYCGPKPRLDTPAALL